LRGRNRKFASCDSISVNAGVASCASTIQDRDSGGGEATQDGIEIGETPCFPEPSRRDLPALGARRRLQYCKNHHQGYGDGFTVFVEREADRKLRWWHEQPVGDRDRRHKQSGYGYRCEIGEEYRRSIFATSCGHTGRDGRFASHCWAISANGSIVQSRGGFTGALARGGITLQ
jgi:hypothetical protein